MIDPFGDVFGSASDVPRLRISLRIVGDELDPDFITQQLGVAPSESGRRGEQAERSRRNGTSVRESGAWVYRISVAPDTELGDALDQLLAAMPQDATLWEELTSTYAVDVLCGVYLEADQQRTTIPADVMERLGRLALPLTFELHSPHGSSADGDGS